MSRKLTLGEKVLADRQASGLSHRDLVSRLNSDSERPRKAYPAFLSRLENNQITKEPGIPVRRWLARGLNKDKRDYLALQLHLRNHCLVDEILQDVSPTTTVSLFVPRTAHLTHLHEVLTDARRREAEIEVFVERTCKNQLATGLLAEKEDGIDSEYWYKLGSDVADDCFRPCWYAFSRDPNKAFVIAESAAWLPYDKVMRWYREVRDQAVRWE